MACAWQLEVDPYRCSVLEKHWPGVPRYGDITTVGEMPYVDLIAGGFPCVTTSQAGLKTGDDDERWLWPEMERVIRQVRPPLVLVENPPGILVRGGPEVLGDLAALGYDAEWETIPASAVGADHVRDRVWVVAYTDSGRREVFGESQLEHFVGEARRFTHGRRRVWRLENTEGLSSHWETEPDVGRVATRFPGRVARLTSLGNAAVPQVVEWIGRRILALT